MSSSWILCWRFNGFPNLLFGCLLYSYYQALLYHVRLNWGRYVFLLKCSFVKSLSSLVSSDRYNLSCITNEETSQFNEMAPFTISQCLIGSDVIVKIPDRFNNLIRNLHSMNEFYLYYHVPIYHLTALRFTRFPCSCAVMQNLSLRISSDQNKS